MQTHVKWNIEGNFLLKMTVLESKTDRLSQPYSQVNEAKTAALEAKI